jgi:hypothetical protein
MHRTTPLLSFLFLTVPAIAQVAVGDIAITGFSSTAFGILGAGGGVTGYTTPGFQGTGLSQTILWDRQTPNSFLVGGSGFVGRATITGPGSVSYGLVTANVGTVVQMSWDDAGFIVFVDSTTLQVRRLDPQTGAVADLTTGPQPWGSTLSAGAFDPATGDVVVGSSGDIFRLLAGGTTVLPITSGLGGSVSGITFDPVTGEVIATVLTVNRVIRIDASGNVSDIAPPFAVPGPNALDVDQNGDFITGGGVGQIYRVPRDGGAPVQIGSYTGPLNGLAVAGAGGYALPFGDACDATFGAATLHATGPFLVGSTILTTSKNHATNSLGICVLGLSRTNHLGIPLPFLLDPLLGTQQCSAFVSLDVTLGGITTAPAPAPLVFSLPITPPFAGQTFFVQHACLEPVPGNLSWSNGLMIRIP